MVIPWMWWSSFSIAHHLLCPCTVVHIQQPYGTLHCNGMLAANVVAVHTPLVADFRATKQRVQQYCIHVLYPADTILQVLLLCLPSASPVPARSCAPEAAFYVSDQQGVRVFQWRSWG